MARKRPSSHSDEQFALFLEKARGMLEAEQHDRFEDVVRNLVLHGGKPAGEETVKDMAEGRSAPDLLLVQPDLAATDGTASETVATQSTLLTLIGKLAFSWSNNESLLIYLLMLLLETDEPSAGIVFSTLNTTRARTYLLRRLAMLKVSEDDAKAEFERLVTNFDKANQLRSQFMEVTYLMKERDGSRNGGLLFDERQPIDPARINAIVEACRDLRRLNGDVLAFLPRLKNAVARSSKARSDGAPEHL
jgi:hypothetical protein